MGMWKGQLGEMRDPCRWVSDTRIRTQTRVAMLINMLDLSMSINTFILTCIIFGLSPVTFVMNIHVHTRIQTLCRLQRHGRLLLVRGVTLGRGANEGKSGWWRWACSPWRHSGCLHTTIIMCSRYHRSSSSMRSTTSSM